MPLVGLERDIPVLVRRKTSHALDRTAAVIRVTTVILSYFIFLENLLL
jgi:hypothetical protein